MWEEIFLNDIEGIQRHVDHYNTMPCNIQSNKTINFDLVKRILTLKTECHAYFYEDLDRQIIMLYKYDSTYDRIVVFQWFDNISIAESLRNFDKGWDIYRTFIKMILERHNKILRISKLPQTVRDAQDFKTGWGDAEQNNQLATTKHAEWGIRATEFERYWEYELM